MKILILGHMKHGKDTLADMIAKLYGLKSTSSSMFVLQKAVIPALKAAGIHYDSLEQAFEDRHNHRGLWHDAIAEYNTPDKSKLCSELLQKYDIYVGMRCDQEYAASKHLVDHIFWVERLGYPPEPRTSMKIQFNPAEMTPIINTGGLHVMESQLIKILGKPPASPPHGPAMAVAA